MRFWLKRLPSIRGVSPPRTVNISQELSPLLKGLAGPRVLKGFHQVFRYYTWAIPKIKPDLAFGKVYMSAVKAALIYRKLQKLAPERAITLVLEQNKQWFAGFDMVIVGKSGIIQTFLADPSKRVTGLLFKTLKKVASQQGCEFLSCFVVNPKLQRLLPRWGFKVHPDYPQLFTLEL